MTEMKATISIIAAIDDKRGIGKNNRLLWNIPEDLQRFKKITTGHPVIMGRKTYESIGRPLPQRANIIVTGNQDYKADGCLVAHSLEEAIDLAKAKDDQEIFIIGGGQLYHEGIKWADKLYLTLVRGDHGADTFFPEYPEFTKLIYSQKKASADCQYTFIELGK